MLQTYAGTPGQNDPLESADLLNPRMKELPEMLSSAKRETNLAPSRKKHQENHCPSLAVFVFREYTRSFEKVSNCKN